MAEILLPADLRIGAPFSIEQRRFDMAEQSDATGDSAVRLGAHPRWAVSIVAPENLSIADAAVWESLQLELDGCINVLAVWDIAKKVPRGSARGSMELAAPAAAGATSISITGALPANGTLLPGDWLGIGLGFGTSQLVKVTAVTTLAGGAGVVQFRAALRRAYAAGAVVTWDRPVCYYRRPAGAVGMSGRYASLRHMQGFSFDGVEVFA